MRGVGVGVGGGVGQRDGCFFFFFLSHVVKWIERPGVFSAGFERAGRVMELQYLPFAFGISLGVKHARAHTFSRCHFQIAS